MKHAIPICAVALTFAISVSAQDTTVRSKTRVKADDASAMTLTGCLQAGTAPGTFMLVGTSSSASGDVTTRSKTKTDVDDDRTKVESTTRTKVDDDKDHVGTAGAATMFDLFPRENVNLTPHVGHQVQITAVAIEPASGRDKDADVRIKEDTKVERENAPDARARSTTKVELPRGAHPRLTAISVKHIAPTCS
jgi:hypothetical protein